MPHPLLRHLHAAAEGCHLEADGGVTFVPPLDDGREAVVAFTGHAVIASRRGAEDLADLEPDGYGRALTPMVLLRLAGNGTIGTNDVTLVTQGTGRRGGSELRRTHRWDTHPRVIHAHDLRDDVEVFGDEHGFVTLGTGLAGRRELSIELAPTHRGAGGGRRMLHEARTLLAPGTLLFAAVSPGNARSLRSFLAAGFVPLASEVILSPGG